MNWNEVARNYDKNVYSITKWKIKNDRILSEIKDFDQILIIGCGSETFLQEVILRDFPNCTIVCSDFYKEMLAISKEKFSHPNISYVCENMIAFSYSEKFDVIISTNSILMPTIEENNKVFLNCFDSLKSNGKLVGYFPSYDSCFNLVNKDPKLQQVFKLNNEEQSVLDTIDNTSQSFHTEKSLINSLNSNFKNVKISKISCSESDDEFEHFKQLYGSVLSDNLIREVFEYYVVAIKIISNY